MVDKVHYNTTLSQTFSPCGNFLLAGNVYGEIAVYELGNILNPADDICGLPKPLYHFNVPRDEQVCSMVTTQKFLVVGTVGEITGWDWSSIGLNKHPKLSWTIQVPSLKNAVEKADVNSMLVSDNDMGGLLYAGCGDKKIHVFSLEDGKHLRSFMGHEDYIHSVQNLGNQLVSAGEDGSVRLWDMRQASMTGVVHPYQDEKIARPHLGKWIGDAAINEDWMVCGGGPRLALWNLRFLDVMTSFLSAEDSGIHVAKFYDDRILAGGSSSHFYHLSFSGDVYAQVETSSTTVYSAVFQETPHKVLCLAGSSPNIDLCTNFSYRDQILSFA